MTGKVMWVELQRELSEAGLNVVLDFPRDIWIGRLDDKPFIMTVSPRSEDDGFRDLLIVSLYGQDEDTVIPGFNRFMEYPAFCKYRHRIDHTSTATYEWDKKDPQKSFDELKSNENVFDLEQLQDELSPPVLTVDMNKIYEEFTPEILAKWEKDARENPDIEWRYNKISKMLPFIRRAMPRIGRKQSLFGFSLICLDRKYPKEEDVVNYGIKPLVDAGIIESSEAEEISNWYRQTKPDWNGRGAATKFKKYLEIDGQKYVLETDSYRGFRDLIIGPVKDLSVADPKTKGL